MPEVKRQEAVVGGKLKKDSSLISRACMPDQKKNVRL